jgi:hypothetical protein
MWYLIKIAIVLMFIGVLIDGYSYVSYTYNQHTTSFDANFNKENATEYKVLSDRWTFYRISADEWRNKLVVDIIALALLIVFYFKTAKTHTYIKMEFEK